MNNILRFLVDQAAGNSGLIFEKSHIQIRTCDRDLNAQRYDTLRRYRDFPSKKIVKLVVLLDDVALYRHIGIDSSNIHTTNIGPNLLNYLTDGNYFEYFDYAKFCICLGKHGRFDLLELCLQDQALTIWDIAGMIGACDSPKLRKLINQYFARGRKWFSNFNHSLNRLTAEQITYLLGLGLCPSQLSPCVLARLGRFEDIKTPRLSDFAILGLDMVMDCAFRFGLDLDDYVELLLDFVELRQFDDIRAIAPTLSMVEESFHTTQHRFANLVWDIESLQAITAALNKDECVQLDRYEIVVDSEEAADWCLFHCHNKHVEIENRFLQYKWRLHRKIANLNELIPDIHTFKNAEIQWLLNEGFQFNLNSH